MRVADYSFAVVWLVLPEIITIYSNVTSDWVLQKGLQMKNILLASIAAVISISMPAIAQNSHTESELTDLANTFARGFYARDPDMVLSTVHPELSKIGVTHNFQRSGIDITEELPPGTLNVLGATYNYNDRLDPVTSTVGVEFYESNENMGMFMLRADTDWYDIFVGTRINGEWTLINCSYGGYMQIENPNYDADIGAITSVVGTYAAGWDSGNYDQVLSSLYLNADRRHVVRGGRREYLMPETLEMIEIELEEREASRHASTVTVFEATQVSGAARIDAEDRTEWVLLAKLNDEWKIVNSFWEPLS